MIKIYLDWNIISQMKNGYNDELLSILSNKEKFFIPFSVSHINDLHSSCNSNKEQINIINEDLDFLSKLTNDYCFLNIDNNIVLKNISPKLIYKENYKDTKIDNPLNLTELLHFEDNDGFNDIGKSLISLLKSIPIDKSLLEIINNNETSINVLFPDLKNNPTYEGLINSIGKLNYNLNKKEDYKSLRNIVQKGLEINRDKIYNYENPYQLIEKAYKKYNLNYNNYIDNSKYAPEWFNKITNEYIMLDMHGYQEDKVTTKKNKRKETFRNTIEDAFHSAYASNCNYYILNDNKSYKKTNQIYKKLNINTFVFKPNEFITYYKTFLDFKDFKNQFNTILNIIKTDNYVEKEIKNGVLRTYVLPFFLFDFFNSINIYFSDKEPQIYLFRIPAINEKETYYFETISLVKKFYEYFGKDVFNRGITNEKELQENNWVGRVWIIEKLKIKLIMSDGYIQLYLKDI